MSHYLDPDEAFDSSPEEDGEEVDFPPMPEVPDELIERMRKRIEESRNRSLNEARVWPPPKNTVKEWKAYGMKCAIARGTGALCGYVHVPANHPDAGAFYDEVDVDVHGGLTFRCKAEDGGAWFGFDCSHLDDWMGGAYPVMSEEGIAVDSFEHPGRIWTVEDVEAETKRLAEQLEERGRRGR